MIRRAHWESQAILHFPLSLYLCYIFLCSVLPPFLSLCVYSLLRACLRSELLEPLGEQKRRFSAS